jgi:hypothetical protein
MTWGIWLALGMGLVHAEVSVFQRSDGTHGTLTPLGDTFSIYSDSHGNTGVVTHQGSGFQSHSFANVQGETTTGSMTTFGSPMPPNNLTPAPVMPFDPNGTLLPQQRAAPAMPFSSRPSGGLPSGGTRLGR